jgi:Protein of unknown function (DUF4235)
MADQDKENFGTRLVYGLSTMLAAFAARKLLIVAWTKVTGKEPPTDPEDPRVALAEALGWSMLVGIAVGAARVLAIRAVARKSLSSADGGPGNAADG